MGTLHPKPNRPNASTNFKPIRPHTLKAPKINFFILLLICIFV